jgi:hypothetical protein
LVTVGVPVYNGQRYLARALDSLPAQTFDDFEIVLCDNASEDRTGTSTRSPDNHGSSPFRQVRPGERRTGAAADMAVDLRASPGHPTLAYGGAAQLLLAGSVLDRFGVRERRLTAG